MSDVDEIIEVKNEGQTESFARKLAAKLGSGDVLLLYGDLGMGKTVLCRALIRALCGDEAMEVPSPTFTLVQSYESAMGPIWHFDLYRLCDPSEVYEIGWEEVLGEGILLVEWPERLGELLPEKSLKINILPVESRPQARRIEVRKT